ncbi:MAG TPA: sulfite exporter TauE/SafE family protein [Beijerinckiaceae bacterium]|nr:sulfite exporter TauE/SafE family protein [Beijerinckiaceae bacterium]
MLGLPLADLLLFAAALLGAGMITGLLAGLFGVGGGAVIVPVLYQIFGIVGVPEEARMHLCVGTSLAIIIPTSIQSFRTHLAKGKTLMDVLKIWALPVIAGVALGAVIAAYAPGKVLKAVFVVVATINAIKLLAGRDDWRLGDQLPGRAGLASFGFVIGLASSLMGIGGGVIANMFLTLFGVSMHAAVATSAGLGVLISIPGALGYVLAGWSQMAVLPPLSLGFISVLGFLLVAPTSTFLAPYGARLAHATPKRRLEIGFGCFLLLTAARFVWSMV